MKRKMERFAHSLDVEMWITPKESFIPLLKTYSVWSYPHPNINDDYNSRKMLTKNTPKVV